MRRSWACLIFFTPIAAITAMLMAPAFGAALGRAALPLAVFLMAAAFALPGQATAIWVFPLAMACAGAATGLTDVLMNARVSAMETAARHPPDEPDPCGLFLRLCRGGDPDRGLARRGLGAGVGDGHDGRLSASCAR